MGYHTDLLRLKISLRANEFKLQPWFKEYLILKIKKETNPNRSKYVSNWTFFWSLIITSPLHYIYTCLHVQLLKYMKIQIGISRKKAQVMSNKTSDKITLLKCCAYLENPSRIWQDQVKWNSESLFSCIASTTALTIFYYINRIVEQITLAFLIKTPHNFLFHPQKSIRINIISFRRTKIVRAPKKY